MEYTFKNFYELIHNIKNINTPSKAKVFFYVQNLFASIPLKEALRLNSKLLDKNCVNATLVLNSSISQIDLNQNYFQFNYITCTNDDGLIMGSPLSPPLADSAMNYINRKFTHIFLTNIFYI